MKEKPKLRLVTSKGLSEIISVPVYTIRELTRKGIIPAYRLTRKGYLYDPDVVVDCIKKMSA